MSQEISLNMNGIDITNDKCYLFELLSRKESK